MKNVDILTITASYAMLKRENQKDGSQGMILPVSVSWKRRLNMKDLFSARETIEEAIRDAGEDKLLIDEIVNQDTDVKIRKIKMEEIADVKVTDAEMDTLMFMIEEE